MTLTAGTRLGPYEIAKLLGVGGMGEVYSARDTRLGRDVALKVLPPELASDPSRRRRFEQEARAVAALSHPNIVAVHDVGADRGVFYIVSELVDGAPLRGASFGLRKTIDIAVQIAAGLAAAHAAGIVHRDLKPENILLTRDGRGKILDFGLAKVTAAASADSAVARARMRTTQPGELLGTVAYMSPEQMRGAELDYRSDIFSFGLILYELLTGERAFQGHTPAEVMKATIKEEAPDLPDSVPVSLRQVVSHCLEKDPANRFQSARDLAFALGTITQTGSAIIPPYELPHTSRLRARSMQVLAAVCLVAMGIAAGRWLWHAPAPPRWSGSALSGPEIAFGPRLSPDGHTLAFAAMVDGCAQLTVMTPETGHYTILSRDRAHGCVQRAAWSPDGSVIYYDRLADGPQGIFSMSALGGEEHLVLKDAGSPYAVRDGTLLVLRQNADRRMQWFRLWPDNGRLQAVPFAPASTLDASRSQVQSFPNTTEVAMLGKPLAAPPGEEPQLYMVDVASGAIRRLATGLGSDSALASLGATFDGESLLVAGHRGNLHEVAAVPRSGRGAPRVLFTSTVPVNVLAGAPDGSVYADQQERSGDVVRFSPEGGRVDVLARLPDTPRPHPIAVLPDGRVIAPVVDSGRTRLVTVEKGKEQAALVTTSEEIAPLFAANEREIAFAVGPEPQQTIAVASISSGRIAYRIPVAKGQLTSLAFSPDGRTLYFAAGGTVWAVPESGGDIQRIASGNSVAASERSLVVQVEESSGIHLRRVPVGGGFAAEVETSVPLAPIGLSPNALHRDGRIVCLLAPPDSWFFLPGVSQASAKLQPIPIDYQGDFHSMGWTPDGQVVALIQVLRARIWKFTPQAP